MSLLRKLFGPRNINSYQDFWDWFVINERKFYKVVKKGGSDNIAEKFFEKLTPKLDELHEGIFFQTGMMTDEIAELVLTPDGVIKNIAVVEELIAAAPLLDNWKFTALKAEMDIENAKIVMDGYEFQSDNISFYANDDPDYPDEINLTFVYHDWNEEDKGGLQNGVYIFLDTFLGELNLINKIDEITIIGKAAAKETLIPIEKLKNYVNWRQKEFVEKYENVIYNSENDTYQTGKLKYENGDIEFVMTNEVVLSWDNKASHQWICTIEFDYSNTSDNLMPDEKSYKLLDEIQEQILAELKESEGHIEIGRTTGRNKREIYYACKDFRVPSKVFNKFQKEFSSDFKINFGIYKDKYWRILDRFRG